jgi:D-3-phosphoglycerate dehydrogenase
MSSPTWNAAAIRRYGAVSCNDSLIESLFMSTFNIVFPDASIETAKFLEDWPRPTGLKLTVDCGPRDSDAALIERCKKADAILWGWAQLNAEVLAACKKLKIASFLGIGIDGYIDMATCRARGIKVCNTPNYGNRTVAEHAIALMFAVSRQIARFDSAARANNWSEDPPGLELQGRRLGIVGFGAIGREVAKMALGLGLEVVAWARRPERFGLAFPSVRFVTLADLFSTSDVISLHLQLNDQTRGMINAQLLDLMLPEAILINTARAGLLDMAALERSLTENRIFGAGLDVFEGQSMTKSGLRKLSNVVLTPHVAYNSTATTRRMVMIGLHNILNYRAGQPTNLIP